MDRLYDCELGLRSSLWSDWYIDVLVVCAVNTTELPHARAFTYKIKSHQSKNGILLKFKMISIH